MVVTSYISFSFRTVKNAQLESDSQAQGSPNSTDTYANWLPYIITFPSLIAPIYLMPFSLWISDISLVSCLFLHSLLLPVMRRVMQRVGKHPRPDLHDLEGCMKSSAHFLPTKPGKNTREGSGREILMLSRFRHQKCMHWGSEVCHLGSLDSQWKGGHHSPFPQIAQGFYYVPARPEHSFSKGQGTFPSQLSPSNISPSSKKPQKRNCQRDCLTLSPTPGMV